MKNNSIYKPQALHLSAGKIGKASWLSPANLCTLPTKLGGMQRTFCQGSSMPTAVKQ